MINKRNEIIHRDAFTIIGFSKTFNIETAYDEIPKFWDEIFKKYAETDKDGNITVCGLENFGEYAVCIDTPSRGIITYIIGTGIYRRKPIFIDNNDIIEYRMPEKDYAVFDSDSNDESITEAVQNMSRYVFCDWLPNNGEYELDGKESIEWYDLRKDYTNTSLWVPVKKIK